MPAKTITFNDTLSFITYCIDNNIISGDNFKRFDNVNKVQLKRNSITFSGDVLSIIKRFYIW